MTKIVKILSCAEKFRKIFRLMEFSSACCGANVMKETYRMNWMTYIVIISIIGAFAGTFYTIYMGVVVDKDWSIMLQALCYLGPGVQGCIKLYSAIHYAATLRFLRSEIDGMYSDFERRSELYTNNLRQSVDLVQRLIWSLFLIHFLTPLAVIGVFLYLRLFLHEPIFLMQFFLPGIDPQTYWGAMTYHIIHVMCVCFSSFGNFAIDFLLFIVVAHIPLIKNILKSKFIEFDGMIKVCPRDATKIRIFLRDIFVWHKKMLNYVEVAKNSFFWIIFVQMGTSTNSIICTLVCHFLGVMPVAPLYLIYSAVIMYAYCALGNLVDVANEDVIKAVYNCLWYELSVSDQKMILIMLRESQKSTGMSIGGISPLSLNTGLQLSKSIYTIAMMLNEYFD